ncbi:Uncharacterized protein GBIM_04619 [Gryllus bimaculatus]|nr:Uncharacterized protein GBIM_04619 [Gryllus bimaculatus]
MTAHGDKQDIFAMSRCNKTEPVEECQFKNQTYQRGDSFKDGCESVCTCGEAGSITCKPRCAPVNNTASDSCVALPDPADHCCTVLRCDVTLADRDVSDAGGEEWVRLTGATALNATAARLEVLGGALPAGAVLQASYDGGASWTRVPSDGAVAAGLQPGKAVLLRAVAAGAPSNTWQVTLPDEPHQHAMPEAMPEGGCVYKGSNYSRGEEFHDGCKAYCQCTEQGVQCADLECPSDFGLDVLDPHCLRWEVLPVGFEPSPPRCCPDSVRCVSNGTCDYGGERFANFAHIPARLTGCERRCYCDAGNVTCQPACQPMPAAPPPDLACAPHEARLDHVPGDDCCLSNTFILAAFTDVLKKDDTAPYSAPHTAGPPTRRSARSALAPAHAVRADMPDSGGR